MQTLSATDCITPAFDRTKSLLFKPFRFGFWCRMALLGLLTGELGSGGCNINLPSDYPKSKSGQQFVAANPAFEWIAQHWLAVTLIAAVLFVLFVGFLYLSSVARFILFEAIVDKTTRLREGWRCWRVAALSYFQFQLALFVCMWGLLLVFIGLPIFFAYRTGLLSNAKGHLLQYALAITFMVAFALLVILVGTVAHVVTKDFVVPVMALEGLSVGPAWRRFEALTRGAKGAFAGYLGMKLLLTIAAAIVFGIGGMLVLLVVLIPVVIVILVVIVVAAASGAAWTPTNIALAVALGVNLLVGLTLILTFVRTPVAVFFPSYSVCFFAGRYQPLYDRLYPLPGTPPMVPPLSEPGPELPPQTS